MTQTLSKDQIIADQFRIVDLLRKSDVAEIYEVRDTSGGQAYVLELMTTREASDSPKWEAFQEHARDAAKLASDVFVNTHEFGKDEQSGRMYMLREFVRAPSLKSQVSSSSPLSPKRVSELLSLLAPAFSKVHKADLAHRGLNHENVFLADGPAGVFARIADFGHAELRAGPPRPAGWSPPEQTHRGIRPSPTADTYSLGLLAFFALTGHPLFKAMQSGEPDARALQSEQRAGPPPASKRAAELGTTIPAALDEFFSRALAVNPSRRYKSVDEMAEAFADAIPDGVRPPDEALLAPVHTAGRVSAPPLPGVGGAARAVPPPPPSKQAGGGAAVPPPPPSKSSAPSAPAPETPSGRLPPPPPPPPSPGAPAPSSSDAAAEERPAMPPPAPDAAAEPPAAEPGEAAAEGEATETPPTEVSAAPDEAAEPAAPAEAATAPALAFADTIQAKAEPDQAAVAAASVPAAIRPQLDSLDVPPEFKKKSPKMMLAVGGGVLGVILVALIVSAALGEDTSEEPASTAQPTETSTSTAQRSEAQQAPTAPTAEERESPEEEEKSDVARVKFVCDPDCDKIKCDRKTLANPSEGVELTPGRHQCVATKKGYLPLKQTISVVAGQDEQVTFKLKKARAGGAPQKKKKKKATRRTTKPCNPFKPCL